MTCEISRAGAGLRRAVETGDYEAAGRWLAEYSRSVTAAVDQLSPGDGRASEAVGHALEFLGWAVRAVRSGRAHTGGGLARVAASRPYRQSAPPPAPNLEMEG